MRISRSGPRRSETRLSAAAVEEGDDVGAAAAVQHLDPGHRDAVAAIGQDQPVAAGAEVDQRVHHPLVELDEVGAAAAEQGLHAGDGDGIAAIGQPQPVLPAAQVDHAADRAAERQVLIAAAAFEGFHVEDQRGDRAAADRQPVIAGAEVDEAAIDRPAERDLIGAIAAEQRLGAIGDQPVAAIGQHQPVGARPRD